MFQPRSLARNESFVSQWLQSVDAPSEPHISTLNVAPTGLLFWWNDERVPKGEKTQHEKTTEFTHRRKGHRCHCEQYGSRFGKRMSDECVNFAKCSLCVQNKRFWHVTTCSSNAFCSLTCVLFNGHYKGGRRRHCMFHISPFASF